MTLTESFMYFIGIPSLPPLLEGFNSLMRFITSWTPIGCKKKIENDWELVMFQSMGN